VRGLWLLCFDGFLTTLDFNVYRVGVFWLIRHTEWRIGVGEISEFEYSTHVHRIRSLCETRL
jgi:hypothetical protein